jgi:hypothetical protein
MAAGIHPTTSTTAERRTHRRGRPPPRGVPDLLETYPGPLPLPTSSPPHRGGRLPAPAAGPVARRHGSGPHRRRSRSPPSRLRPVRPSALSYRRRRDASDREGEPAWLTSRRWRCSAPGRRGGRPGRDRAPTAAVDREILRVIGTTAAAQTEHGPARHTWLGGRSVPRRNGPTPQCVGRGSIEGGTGRDWGQISFARLPVALLQHLDGGGGSPYRHGPGVASWAIRRSTWQIQPVEACASTSSVNNSEGFFQL